MVKTPHVRLMYLMRLMDVSSVSERFGKYGISDDFEFCDHNLMNVYGFEESIKLPHTYYEWELGRLASRMGVDQFLQGVDIKPECFKIIEDKNIRLHVQASLLGDVPYETIVDDVRQVYRVNIVLADIVTFKSLFFDVDLIRSTEDFAEYMNTVKVSKDLLIKCKTNGSDFTRWALGVKISMDAKTIVSDIVTDTYFKMKDAQKRSDVDSMGKLGTILAKFLDKEIKLGSKVDVKSHEIENTRELLASKLCEFDFSVKSPLSLKDVLNDQSNSV